MSAPILHARRPLVLQSPDLPTAVQAGPTERCSRLTAADLPESNAIDPFLVLILSLAGRTRSTLSTPAQAGQNHRTFVRAARPVLAVEGKPCIQGSCQFAFFEPSIWRKLGFQTFWLLGKLLLVGFRELPSGMTHRQGAASTALGSPAQALSRPCSQLCFRVPLAIIVRKRFAAEAEQREKRGGPRSFVALPV